MRRLFRGLRAIFHPEPWPAPPRDETTPKVIADWIAKNRHPDACKGGCQCERSARE